MSNNPEDKKYVPLSNPYNPLPGMEVDEKFKPVTETSIKLRCVYCEKIFEMRSGVKGKGIGEYFCSQDHLEKSEQTGKKSDKRSFF